MQRRTRLSVWMLVGVMVVSGISVLAQYQTFNFMDFDVQVLADYQTRPENVDYLKAAIARELQERGLTQSENPDLLINIGVVIEEKVQTRETSAREDMRYLGQRNYHWEVQEVPVGTYNEGTVTIDLVDTGENKRVGKVQPAASW